MVWLYKNFINFMMIESTFYLLKLTLILKNPIWPVSMSQRDVPILIQLLCSSPSVRSLICVQIKLPLYTQHTHLTYSHRAPDIGNKSGLRGNLLNSFAQMRKLRLRWEKTCPRSHVIEQQSKGPSLRLLLRLRVPLSTFSQHLPSHRHHCAQEDPHSPQAAHLDHLGVKALAYLNAPMGQQHRAIRVHVNQGSCLRGEKEARHKLWQILAQY